MGIFDFLKRSKFSKMSSQVKVREQKYATLLCLEISSLANRRVTLEEKISDDDFKILTITAKALNIGSEYFDCELRKNYKANLDEGDKHFQEVLSSLDIKTKRATIKQMLLIHSNIEKLDNLLDENGDIIIRGNYMTPIERTTFQMGINEELEGLIKNMINEMNKDELNLTERSNSESDLTKIFSFNNDKNDFNGKDLKITRERDEVGGIHRENSGVINAYKGYHKTPSGEKKTISKEEQSGLYDSILDSSLEKKIEDDRLKQLKIEKKEWDLELSIDEEVMCDDGVTRIYNGFMWGLIKEIKEEKRIYPTSIISNEEYDNEMPYEHDITNQKWFYKNGTSLNSYQILSYDITKMRMYYDLEFGELDSGSVKTNHSFSSKIICINGYFFHADSFRSGEPVKLFSGIIDQKEYFNGIPVEESVLYTKKFNSESLKHAVIEWLDNRELAKARYGHISNWNTSEVTDMNRLFRNAHTFNESIEHWDVSNVTNMVAMFYNTKHFNQDISSWDVSNVTNMSGMFGKAEVFNQPIGNWDVSNVMDMSGMFLNAKTFNQPIDKWDTSNVTKIKRMFESAVDFDQPLDNLNFKKVQLTDKLFKNANLDMISKYGENGENLISNIKEESKENIEFNLKNNIMNNTETINMTVTFANTIFSEHPNTSFLIEKCDNGSSDFINISNNCIEGEFEIPADLKNHIEVLKYDIDTSEAFSNGNNYLTMDIDCTVVFNITTTKDEAIDAIEKYEEDNEDLRWNLSIKWIDTDNKEQYSFDSWDEDMLEDIIEDEPCWYEED
jgi:surface protein